MINPDRWLQRCAEDTDENYPERFDDEYCALERKIAQVGIDDSEHDFADTVFGYQSRIMQAIANHDDVMTLMLVKEVYERELKAMVERNLDP